MKSGKEIASEIIQEYMDRGVIVKNGLDRAIAEAIDFAYREGIKDGQDRIDRRVNW